MKVLCIRRINPITDEKTDSDSWLTIGKSYTVLSVSFELQRGMSYRILADDHKTPVLFDARQFEIIDHKIPTNWMIFITGKIGHLFS